MLLTLTYPPFPLRFAWILAAAGVVGCATISEQGQPLVPTRYSEPAGPFLVYSNFPIANDAPAIRCLKTLQRDVEANLGVRVEAKQPPVEVYILNDRESFTHFLKFYYPELPPRRAFFLAQGSQRVVFTFLGDRLEEDLRHEATHALLNLAYGDLPLWLDEGLAEYFETSDSRIGRNPEHVSRLPKDLASGWKPDLDRLETLKSVRQMTPRDYRESWAWVHYLLNGTSQGKMVLLAYLGDLRSDPNASPISARLHGDETGSAQHLVSHLDAVRAAPVAAANPANPADESTIRLQNNPLDALRSPNPRRGFFGKLRSFFSL